MYYLHCTINLLFTNEQIQDHIVDEVSFISKYHCKMFLYYQGQKNQKLLNKMKIVLMSTLSSSNFNIEQNLQVLVSCCVTTHLPCFCTLVTWDKYSRLCHVIEVGNNNNTGTKIKTKLCNKNNYSYKSMQTLLKTIVF